jgi:hypothetical protein
MARPLPTLDNNRSARPAPVADRHPHDESAEQDMNHLASNGSHPGVGGKPRPELGPDEVQELELLRNENDQLRGLCIELEQALQEASQLGGQGSEDRLREYESLLEEKNDTIRQLHQELQHAHSVVAEMEAQLQEAQAARPPAGPAPREEELLALSEELELERRQLQEDERTLMDQMREMEVSMARERAEMARSRSDLTRLQNEVRHELERLEKSGATVRKMEELKMKLSDVTNRRGLAANMPAGASKDGSQQSGSQPPQQPRKDNSGLMGRLFGK